MVQVLCHQPHINTRKRVWVLTDKQNKESYPIQEYCRCQCSWHRHHNVQVDQLDYTLLTPGMKDLLAPLKYLGQIFLVMGLLYQMEEVLWSCEEKPEIFQRLSTPLSDPHQMPYHQHYAQELICHLSGPNHIYIYQQSPNFFILINLFQALDCKRQETTFCSELVLARNLNLDQGTMTYQHDLCSRAQLSIPLESTR